MSFVSFVVVQGTTKRHEEHENEGKGERIKKVNWAVRSLLNFVSFVFFVVACLRLPHKAFDGDFRVTAKVDEQAQFHSGGL